LNTDSIFFEKNGFVIVPAVLENNEIGKICSRIRHLSTAGCRSLLAESWCQELAKSLQTKLALTLPQLSNKVPVQCTLFQKTTKSNWLVPWHQDRTLPTAAFGAQSNPEFPIRRKDGVDIVQASESMLDKAVIVRLHLDACNRQNGALRVIPKSHALGILDTEKTRCVCENHEEVIAEVPKAGALAMKPLLLHASSKSQSTQPRRVLHIVYADTNR